MAQCWLRIGDHLPGPIPPYAGGKTEAKPRGVMLPGHIASLGPPPQKKPVTLTLSSVLSPPPLTPRVWNREDGGQAPGRAPEKACWPLSAGGAGSPGRRGLRVFPVTHSFASGSQEPPWP